MRLGRRSCTPVLTTVRRSLWWGPKELAFCTHYAKMHACFRRAAALFEPPIEPVQVPFEDKLLAGYAWQVDSSGEQRPALIVAGGVDTFAEDCYFVTGPAPAERGCNAIAVDLPGQGLKYLDKRITGIVTNGAVTARQQGLIRNLPTTLDPHLQLPNELGSGICSVPEVVEWYAQDPYNRKRFSAGLCYALIAGWSWFQAKEQEFAYPVLILHGEDDGLVAAQDTYSFFAGAASADRQMKIYGSLYHESFNEYARDEVIGDTMRWILARA